MTQLSPVARRLTEREDALLKVALAHKTLEWDLAATGNWEVLLRACRSSPGWLRACGPTRRSIPKERADRLLETVTNVKGPFAQELAELLDERDDGTATSAILGARLPRGSDQVGREPKSRIPPSKDAQRLVGC